MKLQLEKALSRPFVPAADAFGTEKDLLLSLRFRTKKLLLTLRFRTQAVISISERVFCLRRSLCLL